MKDGFPVTLSEAPVNMMYPQSGKNLRYFALTGEERPNMRKWALGNPLLGASPLTFAVAILWLREHNRLCDQLIARHPRWADQRLFDAARAIVTGLYPKKSLWRVKTLSSFKKFGNEVDHYLYRLKNYSRLKGAESRNLATVVRLPSSWFTGASELPFLCRPSDF